MDNLNWIDVKCFGTELPKRAGMSSVIADNKLIVFGGVKENFALVNDTLVIELNEEKVERMTG